MASGVGIGDGTSVELGKFEFSGGANGVTRIGADGGDACTQAVTTRIKKITMLSTKRRRVFRFMFHLLLENNTLAHSGEETTYVQDITSSCTPMLRLRLADEGRAGLDCGAGR